MIVRPAYDLNQYSGVQPLFQFIRDLRYDLNDIDVFSAIYFNEYSELKIIRDKHISMKG